MTADELADHLETFLLPDRFDYVPKLIIAETVTELRRLAAAEADADQLYAMLDTHWDGGSPCNDWAPEDDEAMALHREAVTRRSQP